MKSFTWLLLVVTMGIEASALSQTNSPAIEWQQVLGGTNTERPWVVRQDGQGGYFVGGESISGISGTKTSPNYGDYDLWLVRLDTSGNSIWDRTYGGNDYDTLTDMVVVQNQGALLLGGSSSGV